VAPAAPAATQETLSALRIGHGYDVHRLVEGRPLILAGVTLDYPLGLLGHSDADVVAHAVADALLGASRLGDIGKLFPDTDPAYKGANSLELLAQVAALLRDNGFTILDVDITLAAQAPKISPHRDLMRRNLALCMKVAPSRVGLKATTTEGLGFVGAQEGMACWAVALLAHKTPA
jgi:2-C-methyl-D-erythritol 2,4-cyclodiphosphate synthase